MRTRRCDGIGFRGWVPLVGVSHKRASRVLVAVAACAIAVSTAFAMPLVAGAIGSQSGPSGSITGRVTSDGVTGIPNVQVDAYKYNVASGVWDQHRSVLTRADGTYTLSTMDTNDYKVGFYDTNKQYTGEWYDNRTLLADADPVHVDAGFETSGRNAVLAPAGRITGTVTSDGITPLAGIGVVAERSTGPGTWSHEADMYTLADGTYTLGPLVPGAYTVYFFDPDPTVYASEYWNDKPLSGIPDTFTVVVGNTYSGKDAVMQVPPSNGSPVAVDDTATITKDATLAVHGWWLVNNDTDPDADSLAATQVTTPENGTIDEIAPGEYLYTPPADWFGVDHFTYRAWDGEVLSAAAATVSITVTDVDHPPVASDCGWSTDMDTPLDVPAPGVLDHVYDPDTIQGELGAWLYSTPTTGSAVIDVDGALHYTPPPGFVGDVTMSYVATDALSMSDPATITVSVLPASQVTRVGGSDRYAVAEGLARAGWDPDGDDSWPGVDTVIIACGETGKEADPLAAAGLAGAYEAPVLLTATGSLPSATRRAITRIAEANPGVSILLVGGTASVPDARWTQIRAIPGVNPTKHRIAGADRYAVTAEIARHIVDRVGIDAVTGVLIVSSENPAAFYDALAASPAAYRGPMPMLGVRRTAVPSSVRTVLDTTLAGKTRYVVSSTTYVSDAVRGSVGSSQRFANTSDRYVAATQIAGALWVGAMVGTTDVGIASKLPDALTGGTFMGRRDGVLLYTGTGATIRPSTHDWVEARADALATGWVFGGTASVPDTQRSEFLGLLE